MPLRLWKGTGCFGLYCILGKGRVKFSLPSSLAFLLKELSAANPYTAVVLGVCESRSLRGQRLFVLPIITAVTS